MIQVTELYIEVARLRCDACQFLVINSFGWPVVILSVTGRDERRQDTIVYPANNSSLCLALLALSYRRESDGKLKWTMGGYERYV
jgi:hypothetical protein